jgi:hypothetical protein
MTSRPPAAALLERAVLLLPAKSGGSTLYGAGPEKDSLSTIDAESGHDYSLNESLTTAVSCLGAGEWNLKRGLAGC